MKPKTRDNLIYLGVALAVVAGFTTYMFYGEGTTGTIRGIRGPILWGILSTPIIVALVLNGFWKYRRRPALWVIAAVVAAINISVVAFACHRRWDPPVLWWSIPTGFCMIPLFVVIQKILGSDRGGPPTQPGRSRPTDVDPSPMRGRHHS